MRRLLRELCEELRGPYRAEADAYRLPVEFFDLLRGSLTDQDYGDWKVAGWIEELNDLVYFIDVLAQLRAERDVRLFAAELHAACEGQFYENHYLDELFPTGRPDGVGLDKRLDSLCNGLARDITQTSLWFVPGLPCRWLAGTNTREWVVPGDLRGNFERAELPGCLPTGLSDACIRVPAAMRRVVARIGDGVKFLVRQDGMFLRLRSRDTQILSTQGGTVSWVWRKASSPLLRFAAGRGRITVGPTLVYGRDRIPTTVNTSPPHVVERIQSALTVIEEAWPAGAALLAALTTRVVPLQARGVVSFSYRHRPGLSFLNVFDRGQLDLIDDLIHENSHHHLNLLLRKCLLHHKDCNQEIFYSPWRCSLRPLRGILHATFTFTMGAILFERLSSWIARAGTVEVRRSGLTKRDILRARFRCLEEIGSVRYSLQDLTYAARELGWVTDEGKSLVDTLKKTIEQVGKRIAPFEAVVLRSSYGVELKRHRQELQTARRIYGPRSPEFQH